MALKLSPYRLPFDGIPNGIIGEGSSFYYIAKPMIQVGNNTLPIGRNYDISPQPIGGFLYDYFLGDNFKAYPYLWNYASWIYVYTDGQMLMEGAETIFISDYFRGYYAREPISNYSRKGNILREPKSIILNDIAINPNMFNISYLDNKKIFVGIIPFYDGIVETFPGNLKSFPYPNFDNGDIFTTDIFNNIYIGEVIYFLNMGDTDYRVLNEEWFPFGIEHFKVFMNKHKRYKLVILFKTIKPFIGDSDGNKQKEFRDTIIAEYSSLNASFYFNLDTVPFDIINQEMESFYGT